MARNHSCSSFDVCDSFFKDLIEIIGDKITQIEIDKYKMPCAAFQAMTVAGQLANLECQIHDEPDALEKEHHKFDMDSEGA